MIQGSPTVVLTIDRPFEAALRLVGRALAEQGLRVATELDVALRIKQQLGAGVAPCVVLIVDDPALLLEAVVFQRGAALLVLQPIVVSARSRQTEILVRSSESLIEGGLPATVREPLLALHKRILQAVESVAEREGAHLSLT